MIGLTFEVRHAGQRQLPGVGCEDWLGLLSLGEKCEHLEKANDDEKT